MNQNTATDKARHLTRYDGRDRWIIRDRDEGGYTFATAEELETFFAGTPDSDIVDAVEGVRQ